jgi:hypothetical protein
MKIYLERIDVVILEGRPHTVTWRGRRYRVEQLLDFWVAQGGWWRGEERRVYMRLLTDHGMMEVYRLSEKEWRLSRMFD